MPTANVFHDDSVILAAGGFVSRETANGNEVMVIHRKRYGDWTIPKGKLKRGESFAQAALREVGEETGCVVRLGEFLGAVGYEVKGVPKVVLYWRMSVVEEGALGEQDEVAEAVWLPVAEAMGKLTYERDRELLQRACN
jgi:8-oxo-dGTP pyrophosphatase MutT (NUDIX family)